MSIIGAFIEKPYPNAKCHYLHFEISNIDLMSYCILINFTNTQWPDMFCNLPIVNQQINYIYCMQNASFALHMWLLLINGIIARGNSSGIS